jgi:predicted nuclease with TOPRIM domain
MLQAILEEKDNVISVMEEQITRLTTEAKRLNHSLKDREQSISRDSRSPISLNINVKPSGRVEAEHRMLMKENDSLKGRMFKMSEIIEKLEKEKVALEEKFKEQYDVIMKEFELAQVGSDISERIS